MSEHTHPARKSVEVTVGKKKIELVELTFEESLAVDKYIPSDDDGIPSTVSIQKIYALAAVRKIDGVPINPTGGELDWKLAMSKFTATEAFVLLKAFNESFGGDVKGEALKNA